MLIDPVELVAAAKATITECSVTDVQECLSIDTLLIDIREPAEFRKGHIPGAVHLPRGLLEFEIHKLVDQVWELLLSNTSVWTIDVLADDPNNRSSGG